MSDTRTPDSTEAGDLLQPADEGEQLVKKTTHEVEPGDMTDPAAP